MTMSPVDWQRVESIYHAALLRPAADRAAFVAEATADDAAIAREVTSLLESGDAAGSLLATGGAWPRATLIGQRLGVYQVVSLLGAGGMGEVYRARDMRLDRDVAIKVLPPAFATDRDRLARFTREAKTLAAINHPNIAHIHEMTSGVFSSGTNPEKTPDVISHALVMELVEGEDLSTLIARSAGRRGIPLGEALLIARQIADALEAAHDLGIIHRDLKPANIKVRADGTVKVLDFGLAKALVPAAAGASADAMNSPTITTPALSELGIVLGTAAYMSPEQAAGKAADKRSDLWSFGVVLFEMLTGRRLFAGETVSHVLAEVLKTEPDWTMLPAETPPAVRRLLRRCLEKDRRRRIADASDVRLELEEAASPNRDGDAATTAPPVANVPVWRRPLPWAGVALAAVIAVLGSVAYLNQETDTGAVLHFTVAPPFGVTRQIRDGFALSPDGQALAYSATAADGRSRIFVRRSDQPDAQPIAGSENGVLPFWSPDSQSLGFTREGGLYRTDLVGAAPRRLCQIPGVVEATRFVTSGGTWGARGVIVFASSEGRLFQVPDGGGTPTPLTSLDPVHKEVAHRSPSFLPDGRRVLFLALGATATRGVIWVVALDNPTRTRVTESSGGAAYAAGRLLTTTEPPRRVVAQPFDPERLTLSGAQQLVQDQLENASQLGDPGFSVSLRDLVVERATPLVHQLVWMDRVGRVLSTIGPLARIPDFALAPDEQRVVANILNTSPRRGDLWLFDGQRTEGTRLTFQPDTRRPFWARDGDQIYFTSMPGFQTWSLRLSDAAQPEPFENPAKFWHFEDITRTSDVLLFKFGEPPAIGMQRISDPSERRVLVQATGGAAYPRVSPDGRWLAYAVGLPAGPEVFVQPFDRPGRAQQVSTSGGIGPVWRADGRELFFEAPSRFMAVAISGNGDRLGAGTPEKFFDIHTRWFAPNHPHNVEVADNGQKFLVNTIVGNSDNVPLHVIVNWLKALGK